MDATFQAEIAVSFNNEMAFTGLSIAKPKNDI
jgi:hypothetical protein